MASWPDWVENVVWTAAIVLAAYVIGHTLRVFVGARLKRLAARTASRSDDVLLDVVDARVGLWSLLIGIYFALPHWPLTPRGYETWVRVLSAIGVASFTFGLATLATQLVVSYGSRTSTVVTGLTQNVIRIVVTVLGALVIVKSFGYDITPMLTALGVGGLAVALALQEPLSNLFAGLFVSFAGQIHVGNYVKLDNGAEGFVVDFNWRSTRLRQLAGNMIEVPNAKLSQAVVTNFSLPTPEMGMGVDVVVDMDSDLAAVERIAAEVIASVAQDVPGVVSGGDVRFQGFVDAGIKFSAGVKVREFTDQFLVKHELVKRLHARLTAEHIELADIRALRRGGKPT
jgi:small-conductance mechanosensitive channel